MDWFLVSRYSALQIISSLIQPALVEETYRTIKRDSDELCLPTGAKLKYSNWSESWMVSGYAYDGRDVRPYEQYKR